MKWVLCLMFDQYYLSHVCSFKRINDFLLNNSFRHPIKAGTFLVFKCLKWQNGTWDLTAASWWFGFICFEEPSFFGQSNSQWIAFPPRSLPFLFSVAAVHARVSPEHFLCVACPVTTSRTSRNYTSRTPLKTPGRVTWLARRMVWLIFPGDNLNATLLTVSPNHINFSRTLRGLRGRTNVLPNFYLYLIYNNFLHN